MKKWKVILKITLIILLIFIGDVLFWLFKCYTADVKYPYPALGIDINNWFEAFSLEVMLRVVVYGIPLIIDIILLIISSIKIRIYNRKNIQESK